MASSVDWSIPQPSYEELHNEISTLKRSMRMLQEAYDSLKADHDAAHKVVDFLIEHRAS